MTDPQAFNLAHHVLTTGEGSPDKLALSILGLSRAERWSFSRLIAAVRGTGTGLLGAGVKRGDRILLRIGNRPTFPIAYLGAIAVGIVPVPTSAMLTGPEITRIARDIDPALVIAADGVALPDHPAPVMHDTALTGFEDLPPAEWDWGDAERLAYIIYTSGSSGQPRAVMHAHRAILARKFMFDGWYDLRADDRLLHAGAFNWTFTLGTGILDPWTMGATALIPADGIAPRQIPLLARRHGATIIAAAPGVFRKMLQTDFQPWPALRHGLAAGERLDPALRREWQARTGTDLHEAMGMSECSTFLSGSPARPAPEGTAGYAQNGRKVAVLGDDDQPAPEGVAGRLAVHAGDPGLFLGYLHQPEETAARRVGDWFLTGDIARHDAGGAISMLGRSDDVMNAGGYRVAPNEIEEVVSTLPDAGDVAATEIAVKKGASVIALFWTGAASEDALRSRVEENLARYKQPRAYIHLDALPLTATGKINRRALREAYARDRS